MLVDSDLNDNIQHVFTSLRDSAFEIAKTDMYRGERYPFALFRCDSCSFHICVFQSPVGSHLWVTHALPFSCCFFSYRTIFITQQVIILQYKQNSVCYYLYISVSCIAHITRLSQAQVMNFYTYSSYIPLVHLYQRSAFIFGRLPVFNW